MYVYWNLQEGYVPLASDCGSTYAVYLGKNKNLR